jgi:hypothetical protein
MQRQRMTKNRYDINSRTHNIRIVIAGPDVHFINFLFAIGQ